jgi:LacI family transcriptional regulator
MKKFRVALFFDLSRQYDRDVIQGILNFSNEIHRWEFFYEAPHYLEKDEPKRQIQKIIRWKPDGIIARGINGWEKLLALKKPIILSPHYDRITGVTNIYCDNEGVGTMVAKEFIKKGFLNFSFFGDSHFYWSRERQDAYENTLKEYNKGCYIPIPSEIAEMRWEDKPNAIAKWLVQQNLPIAIMAASDEYSQLLVEAIHIAELKIPSDVSIIGVDNDRFICELSNPTLSSVDQDAERSGYLSAKTLHQMMERNTLVADPIISRPRMIVRRKSSDEYAIADENVRNAITFIRKNAPSRDVTVEEVVNATHLSRRSLEQRFSTLLNQTIHDFISMMRIETVCSQLENSEKTVKEIAFQANFNSVENLSKLFKKVVGCSPSEFRKKRI